MAHFFLDVPPVPTLLTLPPNINSQKTPQYDIFLFATKIIKKTAQNGKRNKI